MDALATSDIELLLYINSFAGRWPWLDNLMLFASSKFGWIPLYIVILWLLTRKYGQGKIFWVLILSTVTLVITDQGTVVFFKELFQRLRPCHVPGLLEKLSLINSKCGGSYGFVSSHAANTFGFAMLMNGLLKDTFRMTGILFAWATLIALSRCYLGVHYPSDVIVGGMFGIVVGFCSSVLANQVLKR